MSRAAKSAACTVHTQESPQEVGLLNGLRGLQFGWSLQSYDFSFNLKVAITITPPLRSQTEIPSWNFKTQLKHWGVLRLCGVHHPKSLIPSCITDLVRPLLSSPRFMANHFNYALISIKLTKLCWFILHVLSIPNSALTKNLFALVII